MKPLWRQRAKRRSSLPRAAASRWGPLSTSECCSENMRLGRVHRAGWLLGLVVSTLARASSAQLHAGEGEALPQAPKLTKPPILVKFVEAPFPEAEQAKGQGATVVLQIAISATGGV